MAGRSRAAESAYLERSRLLASLLRSQRINVLKISRRELAARTGVSASTIQAIEDGRTVEPGVFTLIALAVALNLDLSEMVRTVQGPISPKPLHRFGADG